MATHNDIELGVDVTDSPIIVQDGQGGDAMMYEEVEGLNQRHVFRHLQHTKHCITPAAHQTPVSKPYPQNTKYHACV